MEIMLRSEGDTPDKGEKVETYKKQRETYKKMNS